MGIVQVVVAVRGVVIERRGEAEAVSGQVVGYTFVRVLSECEGAVNGVYSSSSQCNNDPLELGFLLGVSVVGFGACFA